MKIKPLKITFEPMDKFINRTHNALKEAVHHKKKSIQDRNVLVWASVEAYQQFMSDQKYTILATIYKYRPQSVYQLAKMLNRAQHRVRDKPAQRTKRAKPHGTT